MHLKIKERIIRKENLREFEQTLSLKKEKYNRLKATQFYIKLPSLICRRKNKNEES